MRARRTLSLFKDVPLRTRRALSLFRDVPLRTRRALSLFKDVPLRTRRALSLFKDVLLRTRRAQWNIFEYWLALLALNWWYQATFIVNFYYSDKSVKVLKQNWSWSKEVKVLLKFSNYKMAIVKMATSCGHLSICFVHEISLVLFSSETDTIFFSEIKIWHMKMYSMWHYTDGDFWRREHHGMFLSRGLKWYWGKIISPETKSRDLYSSRNIISNPKILGTFRDVPDNKVAICYIVWLPIAPIALPGFEFGIARRNLQNSVFFSAGIFFKLCAVQCVSIVLCAAV